MTTAYGSGITDPRPRSAEGTAHIPAAPWYVTCTDSLMSGWGMAEGMINRVVLPCESHDEALIVAQNAENRAEMKRVGICSTKPRARQGTLYSVLTRDDAERWFTPGGFAPEPRGRWAR